MIIVKKKHIVNVCSFCPLALVEDLSKFQSELCNHPDRSTVSYILAGLRDGFRLGFTAFPSNMLLAYQHPTVINEYLQSALGRIAGPFSTMPYPHQHISRFGVIPKSNQPGKWRLIYNLSSPEGHSVNDGIPKLSYSVQYVTIDDFIDGIMA